LAFFSKNRKIQEKQNPSSKHFCENFMGDGNVSLNEFYQIPSKKIIQIFSSENGNNRFIAQKPSPAQS
jgi:hypothetical protein